MDEDNIITLNDENGNEVEFEFLDLIPYRQNEYVVLLPIGDSDGHNDTTRKRIIRIYSNIL